MCYSCSFKNTKFPRGNYQTDSSETETPYCLKLFTTKFSSSIFNYFFQLLRVKDSKAKMYQMKQNQTKNSLNITTETKPGKKPTKMTVGLQNISQTGTIHPGIFLRPHYGLIVLYRGRPLSCHVSNLNQSES